MTTINTPEGVRFYRLLALKGALTLEIKGIKRSGGRRTAYSILKGMGYRGTRKKVLQMVTDDIKVALELRVCARQ